MSTRKVLLPMATLLLSACAINSGNSGAGGAIPTYVPAGGESGSYTHKLDASREQIMKAAKRVIIDRGYSIADWDPETGTVSTHAIRDRLPADAADCGVLEGVDNPLTSDRTKGRTQVGIVARDGAASIHLSIEAEYRIPGTTEYLVLHCVSKGAVEQRVADAIRSEIGR